MSTSPSTPSPAAEKLLVETNKLLDIASLPPRASIRFTMRASTSLLSGFCISVREAATVITGAIASAALSLRGDSTSGAEVDELVCELRLYDLQLTSLAGTPLFERLEVWSTRNICGILHAAGEWISGTIPFLAPANLALLPVTSVAGFYTTKDNRTLFIFFNVYNVVDCNELIAKLKKLGADSREKLAAHAKTRLAFDLEADLGYFATVVRTPSEWRTIFPNPSPPFFINKLEGGNVVHVPLPPRGTGQNDLPLAGVKVISYSKVVAAPYAARLLAEMGAEVLNVRNTNGVRAPLVDFYSTIGKRSILLDLQTPSGRERAQELLATADVVVTNLPTLEQVERLGIGPRTNLAERKPFVHFNITAFPVKGYAPDARDAWVGRKGYAPMAAAACGMFHEASTPEMIEDAIRTEKSTLWPVDGYPEDYFAGMLGVVGILSALKRRADQGGSYLVETSLAESCEYAMQFRREPSEPSPLADFLRLAEDHSTTLPTPFRPFCCGKPTALTVLDSPMLLDGFAPLQLAISVPRFGDSSADEVHSWEAGLDSNTEKMHNPA